MQSALEHYPNCRLFNLMINDDSIIQSTFLFATPFVSVATHYDHLYTQARAKIALPRAGETESWYPVAFADLPDDVERGGGQLQYRIYKSLVLRIAFLLRCIKTVFSHRTAEPVPVRREHYMHMEHQLYHWLDAHMLLMIGIDQLGHIPHDDSEAMRILIERYSPDVHTALSEGEMPDLSAEVARCSFFTPGSDTRKDDPLIYTISKALPHRCEVREVAVKVAEVAAHNAGYFGFIKLVLAAMFLGIYHRCNYRAGWRMRFAVYRLFFFTMDKRLLPMRTSVLRGGVQTMGGSAASMEKEYNLNSLCDSLVAPMSPSKRRRAEATNTRLQYASYTAIVASKFASSTDAGRARRQQTSTAAASTTTAVPKKKKSSTKMRQDGTRHWRPGYDPTDNVTAVLVGTMEPLGTEQFDCDINALRQGIHVANSMSRMHYEKNCGVDYYEQRRAAGTLPASGITLRDGTTPPPPPPSADPDDAISYAEAYKAMLPCDRELPSEEEMQRDSIIYHWITTLMLRDKSSEASGSGIDREYIFQNAINLAVREYLIFVLQRWLEPLRQELFARVSWASWEESVKIFGDGLRQKLDKMYVLPCPLGTFLTGYSAYQWMSNLSRSRPINNHYTSERESFLSALKRLMKAKINSGGFGDAAVDRVVPRETEILIQHLLQHWRYPRVAPPINYGAVRRAETIDESEASTLGGVFERYQEKITAPQLVYLIEPVSLPPALPLDGDLTTFTRREYVSHARFPLGIFHASDEMIRRFASCRLAYHYSPSDPVVKEFVGWLAEHSAYQFFLLRTYCKVMERYIEIHTFSLPRHIAEHQLRTLRSQFCVPAECVVPPHLMRSLVCTGCKRCASVFSSSGQRQTSMAVGNDEVRFVSITDDDEVFEHVRARGNLPLPLSALQPAASWTEVLQHRSRANAEVYDRYCGVQESSETSRAVLEEPEQHGHMAIDPTSADLDAFGRNLFADTFVDTSRFATPTDRRTQIYDDRVDPSGLAMQSVARGQGRIGELNFDTTLWKEVDRRMRIFDGTGADNSRSFLLLGHSFDSDGAEADYASIKWSDTTSRIKAEGKKTKQSNAHLHQHNAVLDPKERAKKLDAFYAKRRRDADSLACFALCARRRMVEIDFCGRALRACGLDGGARLQIQHNECILACCDCLARIWSHQARAIADRIVCEPCYVGAKHNGGSVAQRAIRGESSKIVSATTAAPQNAASALRTRTTALQTHLSPSFAALTSEVVPMGTTCIMDRCKAFKSDDQAMFGLEVLLDTNVGNETYAYVYFCQKHARTYQRLFRIATKLPLSTLKSFMMENRRDFDQVMSRGSFLDDVMRRAAHATGIGTQARAEEELRRKKKREAQLQRRQRVIASTESARQRDAASSSVVSTTKPGRKRKTASVTRLDE